MGCADVLDSLGNATFQLALVGRLVLILSEEPWYKHNSFSWQKQYFRCEKTNTSVLAYAKFVTAQNFEEWTSKGKIVNRRFSFNTVKNATVEFICFPNFPEQFIFLEDAARLT